jgi:hypothetical protein
MMVDHDVPKSNGFGAPMRNLIGPAANSKGEQVTQNPVFKALG